MKKSIFLFIALVSLTINAQEFETHFENKTLRLDYTFTGTTQGQDVALDQLSQLPQWAGRRVNMTELGRNANGQIHVYDKASKEIIYKESFSSLFQEWLLNDEAEYLRRSYENTFLIPYPKNEIIIEVSFRQPDGEYKTLLTHTVNPTDILIQKKGNKHVAPYTTIAQGGAIDQSINVVIVAEGYTAGEMDKFRAHAQTTCDALFAHAPFGLFKNKFNIYAVESVSTDSGVSVPRSDKWQQTTVSSHFDTFHSERYLTTSHVKDLHDVLAGVPYAHIIILANTDVYGGGGIYNSYTLTTTGHANFKPVVVHEFGHSFAGLADEYFYEENTFENMYPFDVEPWEPNISTLVDFSSKWEDMLAANTPIPTSIAASENYKVSVIEGAGYSAKNIYRANVDCRMKTNTSAAFCPVCQRAIERLIKFYTE